MKKFPLVVCLLSTLLASGCHPISVKTGYARGADFAGRGTYAWDVATKLDTGDPRFDTQQMERAIRGAVDAALAAKGFQKTDSVTPGFLVAYAADIGSGTSTVTRRWTLGDGTGDWRWTGSHTVSYDTGAFLLEMRDPTTKRMLWQAVASAVVIKLATAAERQERIVKAVRKMLADFPPQ